MFKVEGLPASLRIGPHDVRLVFLSAEEGEEKYGYFMESDLEIAIRPDYVAPSMAVDSLLHEILHAVWFVGTIKPEHGEEQIIQVQATNLAQVLRDNPKLVEWIQKSVAMC